MKRTVQFHPRPAWDLTTYLGESNIQFGVCQFAVSELVFMLPYHIRSWSPSALPFKIDRHQAGLGETKFGEALVGQRVTSRRCPAARRGYLQDDPFDRYSTLA